MDIYSYGLGAGKESPCLQRVRQVENDRYFEKFLWPNFDAGKASAEHVLLIMMIVKVS